jgi:PAS domain-containing protein
MLGIRIDDERGNVRDDCKVSWNKTERDLLEKRLTNKSPFLDFVYSRTPQDGPTQYLMVSGEPLFDASGRLTGYRGVGKDVTESMCSKA